MAEEDLMTEDVVDEGIGRRGIDMDYVKKRVDLHFETERNANRRRGQSVFNELIAKGTPYADALREAGNAGLFYDNVEGQQRAFQNMEALKSRAVPNSRAIAIPGKGIFERNIDTGKYELTQPVDAPVKPAPIVATRKDPITDATIRMNADQLSQEQVKSTLEDRSKMEPRKQVIQNWGIPYIGSPIHDPAALEKNTSQLRGLRLDREASAPASIPQMPSATNAPAGAVKRVRVKSPSGKGGWIPESQLQEALSTGYTRE